MVTRLYGGETFDSHRKLARRGQHAENRALSWDFMVWRVRDSNPRSLRRLIYSQIPLATWVTRQARPPSVITDRRRSDNVTRCCGVARPALETGSGRRSPPRARDPAAEPPPPPSRRRTRPNRPSRRRTPPNRRRTRRAAAEPGRTGRRTPPNPPSCHLVREMGPDPHQLAFRRGREGGGGRGGQATGR